jgi:hypothetical protein
LVSVVCSGAHQIRRERTGPGVGRGLLRYTPAFTKLQGGWQRAAGRRAPTDRHFTHRLIPVAMMPVSMMIIMMMPMVPIVMVVIVICLNNITAVSAYCLWKWCNRCGFQGVRNSNRSESCHRNRKCSSFHGLSSFEQRKQLPLENILSSAQTYGLDPDQCGIGRYAAVLFAKEGRADCRISERPFCCLSLDASVG